MQVVRFGKPVWAAVIAVAAVGTAAGVTLTWSNGPASVAAATASASPSGQLVNASSPATTSASASRSLSPSASASHAASASASASASATASAARSTAARADRAQPPAQAPTTAATTAAATHAAPTVHSTPAPVKPAPAVTTAPTVSRPGGRPGSTNTGVPAGTALSVVSGDLVVTTPGAVIDAKDIKGALIIKASNVKVTRSHIEGRAGSDSVVISSGYSGIVLQDDEVSVAHPAPGIDAMSVRGATLNRLNIHGGVDGMKLSSNSVVENSWIHDLNYFSSDPAQGGGPTHNDTIQIMSGTNIHVTGNYLQAVSSNNAAIQVTQDTGTTSGVYISGNWADGGGCTFNFSGHGPGGKLLPMSGISATNNRFGHNTKFAGCAILTDLQTTLTQSGNVFDDTGKPIVVQRHN